MFEKIMVAVDLMHESRAARVVAMALSIGDENTQYQLVSVVPPVSAGFVSSFLPKDYDKQMIEAARLKLHEFSETHFPKDAKVKHIIAHGTIYEEINRLADEREVDLIVINATKPGSGGGLGPNAARVSRYSNKTVMVVR
ncbi:universal stress protein [Cardiobacteriaceae bacterium TAE3-ERU3]|nr:universal stress protein [Cardiobacteriaceae bacterium TAE3-ERU3]